MDVAIRETREEVGLDLADRYDSIIPLSPPLHPDGFLDLKKYFMSLRKLRYFCKSRKMLVEGCDLNSSVLRSLWTLYVCGQSAPFRS